MSRSRMPPPFLAGRFLAYTSDEHQCVAMAATRDSAASGIVVRGSSPLDAVRRARSWGYESLVLPEVAAWRRDVATISKPTVLEAPDGFEHVSLDSWAASLLDAGADAVFTPSKFVRLGDWRALRAVLKASAATTRSEVVTLVATDAGMLDSAYLSKFTRVLARTDRPLALIFAAKSPPFDRRGRVAGLRWLVARLPACLLLAADPLVATDAYARGASSVAIGVSRVLRQPRRPGDSSGGNNAKDFVPGLFLRDLWEHRSPGVYADWFANTPSPTCQSCGGRALDTFDSNEADKEAVFGHNVHTWLAVLDELRTQTQCADQRSWAAREWAAALEAHLSLRPTLGSVEADPVLRQLVELDDPHGRRTTPQGALR